MKANGFGSWEQKIIVHVDKQHADQVAAKLGLAPVKEAGDPVRVYFEWSRLTTTPRDDEGVVWDLSALLGLDEAVDWTIDWAASDY